MHIDYKVTVWRRMEINSPDNYDEMVRLIEEHYNYSGSTFNPNSLYDYLLSNYTEPFSDSNIDETEESFTLDENNGSATVELFNDEDELLYDNVNGKLYE